MSRFLRRHAIIGAIKHYIKYSVSGTFLKRVTANGLLSAHDIKRTKVKEVRGKSVVWNQLLVSGDIYSKSDRASTSYANHVLSVTQTVSSDWAFYITLRRMVAGHKYICATMLRSNEPMRILIGFPTYGFVPYNITSEWQRAGIVFTAPADIAYVQYARLDEIPHSYEVYDHMLIDLTLMFGAGNEPATVADFEDWLRTHINTGIKPYYPYNEGEIVNTNLTGFKTILRNQLKVENNTAKAQLLKGKTYKVLGTRTSVLIDGSEVTITDDTYTATDDCEMQVVGYSDDTRVYLENSNRSYSDVEPYTENTYNLDVKRIYGKLNGEGSYVKPYPEGMRGAGSVGDELKFQSGQSWCVKKSGSYTFTGQEYWIKSKSTFWWETHPNNAKMPLVPKAICNLICSKYNTNVEAYKPVVGAANKSLAFYVNGYTYVQDDSIETADAFASSMKDVEIVFELAIPLEYTNLMYDTSLAGDGSQLVPLSALKLNVDADGVEMQTFPVDGNNVTSVCGEVTIDYEYK